MRKSTQTILDAMQSANQGSPWFGKSIFDLLDQVQEEQAFTRPLKKGQSAAALLYHMITWSSFVLDRLSKKPIPDLAAFEAMDWQKLDPAHHNWSSGIIKFKEIQAQIIELLATKDDSFLKEKVDYRDYDFHYMLEGLIQHNM